MTNVSISTGTIIRFFLIFIFFYFLYYIKDVVLVILTAIVVASAIEPGTRWFKKRRISRVPAVILMYAGVAAFLVSTFYFLLIPLAGETASFLQSLPEYSAAVQKASAAPDPTSILSGFSESFSLPGMVNNLNKAVENFSTGFVGTIDVIFGGIVSFLLIVALSFYLAVQEDGVGKFLKIIAPVTYEGYIIDLWRRSKEKIGLWMQGQLLLGVIIAVLAYLGLTIIGVRNALLLSFVAGAFELIPLFGSFLAAAPAIAIAFIDGGVTAALLVTGLFVIINQFESQLIYPLVVKKVIGVPPIISILAIVIGAKLAGFLGVLISVPLAAVLMELLNDFEKRKQKDVRLQ
jgi:predicted PurR-regulated permease PerM